MTAKDYIDDLSATVHYALTDNSRNRALAVTERRVVDADGKVVDPEQDRVRWDEDLTFTATR